MAGLVMFSATMCGHCKQMYAIMNDIKADNEDNDKLEITTIVVDDSIRNRELATEWNVTGVPTFLFIKNGGEVHRALGAQTKDNLNELLESFILNDSNEKENTSTV